MAINSRVKKLRDKMLTIPEICTERGHYMTESYKETENYPDVIRRAKALEKILLNMTIRIEDGELIVGWPTSKIRGGALLPELNSQWILNEIDTVSTRDWDKYAPLTDAEKKKIREFMPFWEGKSLSDKWSGLLPDEEKELEGIIQTSGGMCRNGHHLAHVAVDYELVLNRGLAGVISIIDDEIAKLSLAKPEDFERYQFLISAKLTNQAVIAFSLRYAELAESMAKTEIDEQRKTDLERISQTCRKVPAHPAESFYEAIQSIWFVYIPLMIESWGAGMSLGRVDQYLYPFYKKDLNRGIITGSTSLELISLLLIKMNAVINVADEIVTTFLGGYPVMQGLTLGGVTKDGKDAVNELSYLFLDAEKDIGLNAEDVVIRVNKLNRNNIEIF
ncbi:pyruvate formate lyase family protein [Sporomusa aerivorans]|uniref:pyruvate formate lyase family protein n=1 Tax=Sporomusa aerivorans TaxID=204936 RepID=UPI00352B5C22